MGGPHPEGALRGSASHPGAPLVQDVSPEPVEDAYGHTASPVCSALSAGHRASSRRRWQQPQPGHRALENPQCRHTAALCAAASKTAPQNAPAQQPVAEPSISSCARLLGGASAVGCRALKNVINVNIRGSAKAQWLPAKPRFQCAPHLPLCAG